MFRDLKRACLPPLAGALAAACLAAGAAAEENKVIVREFDWRIYATEHFDVHYYADSEPWVPYAASVLEENYARQSAAMNPRLDKRIPFFLYRTINEMQQNNVAQVGDGVGGFTEPFKDRFMVWSDGSREWLRDVITHEFAHEIQFSVLIDGFWKSARILKTYIYPLWMMEGLSEYSTGEQDIAMERMYLRDAALSPEGLPSLVHLAQFAHLKPHQVTLGYKTGGSAIRFLAEEYGREKPRRMLELYRSRYDASSVLGVMVGTDIFEFDRKFREYTRLKYLAEQSELSLKEPSHYGRRLTPPEGDIPEFNTSPRLAPGGGTLAYLSTRQGHPPVVSFLNTASGKRRSLTALKAGAENIPYGRFTQPINSLALSPDGRLAAFTGQKNHREYVYLHDLKSRKTRRFAPEGLTEARQPVFSPDGRRLAFVGMKGAFNDVYELDLEKAPRGGPVPVSAVTVSTADESSPAYWPGTDRLAFSCEIETSSGPGRDLCWAGPGGGGALLSLDGNEQDPAFSPDGARLAFVSDRGGDYDLYMLELSSGAVYRLTRGVGGAFTPSFSADGKTLVYSVFRGNSMHAYESPLENFEWEPVPVPAPVPTVEPPALSSGSARPYKFKASTDLFFPAFLFSSPGGLFWMNYWAASDMLGNHNMSMFLSYNSGADFLNLQLSYLYARYRTQFYVETSVFTSNDNLNDSDLEYDKRYWRQTAGAIYPFDRYNRAEFYLVRKNETVDYTQLGQKFDNRLRAAQASYIRDTVNGLYLTATMGSRLQLSYIKAAEVNDGNEKYDAYVGEYTRYFPLSKRSSIVNRFVAAESLGRDKRTFDFGGLGGVRGFSGTSDFNSASRAVIDNFEIRFPLIKDINYYMWYMFPDFYFKTIYMKLFADAAYGWEDASGLNHFAGGKVKTSVGVGINVHTFILQAFQMVLSFDWAVRTHDGGKIFYFYLGPMF